MTPDEETKCAQRYLDAAKARIKRQETNEDHLDSLSPGEWAFGLSVFGAVVLLCHFLVWWLKGA